MSVQWAALLGCRLPTSCVLTWQSKEVKETRDSHRALISFMKTLCSWPHLSLITSQRPHLSISLNQVMVFQHVILGGWHIQSIILTLKCFSYFHMLSNLASIVMDHSMFSPFYSLIELSISNVTFFIFSSVQFSHSVMSDSLWPHELQHARPPCLSPTPGVYPTHVHRVGDAIQPSHPVVPFSFCPQSFPASESFPMSQLFASGGQSTGVSAWTLVLPINIQDWSPLGWTGWITLQSKGLSRVFSNATVQKYQFFGAQLSSQSNSHIHTWPLEKP